MDFLRKDTNQNQAARPVGAPQTAAATANASSSSRLRLSGDDMPQWVRIASFVLLVSLAILTLATASLVHFGSSRESKLIDTNRYQAVFLTNGQVYFGKVREANNEFINLQDIYYLNSQDTGDNKQAANFSLVKLGCELHKPGDMMVINRSQVSFWENIETDGKVANGIKQWQDENKGKDKRSCAEPTNSTQQSQQSNQQTSDQNASGAPQQATDTQKKQ